jgi:ribosomal protein L21E
VTVAYTKPSSNPLQTSAGGQAASFSAQNVTNNVSATSTPPSVVTPPATTNTPPVVNVNYIKSINSGFVGTLNASGSYDANKDNLIYTRKAPANFPVSATNGPIIQYLAPVVDTKQTYDFTLVVSDGKSPQTKVIPVEILPYQPELESAEVVDIETDESLSSSQPYNIVDGNIGTIWSVQGRDQWIILELKTAFNIQHVKLAFQPNLKREFFFDIYGSNDKVTWDPILSKSSSCAFSGNLQVFDFPESKAEKEYKYVKVVGQGNSVDQWNYIAEFRIFGYRHRNPAYEEQIVKIYPNPAREMVNIKIDEPSFVPDFINILTLSGKIIYTNIIEPDKRLLQIPVNFSKGIYLIQMGKGSITMFSQKLVVAN